jgi:hypothetical protein
VSVKIISDLRADPGSVATAAIFAIFRDKHFRFFDEKSTLMVLILVTTQIIHVQCTFGVIKVDKMK